MLPLMLLFFEKLEGPVSNGKEPVGYWTRILRRNLITKPGN